MFPDILSNRLSIGVLVVFVCAMVSIYLLQADTPIVPAADVRVSPHGFGAYPEIPVGAPISPFDETDSLLGRVMVQKWNEGERFVGGTINDGKVYLIYPNVLYVRWQEKQNFLTGKITRSIVGARSNCHTTDT